MIGRAWTHLSASRMLGVLTELWCPPRLPRPLKKLTISEAKRQDRCRRRRAVRARAVGRAVMGCMRRYEVAVSAEEA